MKKRVKITALNLLPLNCISHFAVHFYSLQRSFWSSSHSIQDFTIYKSLASSANLASLLLSRTSSVMNKLKSTGPRINPWGMLLFISVPCDNFFVIIVLIVVIIVFLFFSQLLIHKRTILLFSWAILLFIPWAKEQHPNYAPDCGSGIQWDYYFSTPYLVPQIHMYPQI